jgi:phage tail sheath protein FI
VKAFRDAVGSINLKYGAAYAPNLETVLDYSIDETTTVVDYFDAAGTAQTKKLSALAAANSLVYESAKAAIRDLPCVLPPSSTMAGVYASVDATRGGWTAPANVSLAGVIKPTIEFTSADQESMNDDAATGKSVNAIRSFTGKGTLVWGARTLAGNDAEWRYINVRRLFIFIEESCNKACASFVFEPNDANTWVRVQGMIENFLTVQWRQGALQGAKPEHAFTVAVGLGKTMTAQDLLDGRMIVEVGLAAVRPAEFIILRFYHKLAQS